MMSVTTYTSPSTAKLREVPALANRLLKDFVKEGTEFGDTYMTEIVPTANGRLQSAVTHTGPFTIELGTFLGIVGVDQAIAPHAEDVDKGTGVDGPFRQPVSIIGVRNSRGHHPAMRFVINGRVLFRQTVKSRPSVKIQRGKNYSGRTYDRMRDWAQIHSSVLANDLAMFIAKK